MADYNTLLKQVTRPFEKKQLDKIARNGVITADEQLPGKAVRLNSIVYLWHSLLRKVVRIKLVPPAMADLASRNVSALSPLGQAVFGYNENDLLKVRIGGIKKELKIVKVLNR